MTLNAFLKKWPPDFEPAKKGCGIPGYYNKTIRKMVPKNKLSDFLGQLCGNTVMIDPKNGQVVNYFYDVHNAYEFVMNKKPYLWD